MHEDFNKPRRRWQPGLLLGLVLLGVGITPALAQELSAQAQSQIGSLLAEKEARTPTQQKLDSQLIYAAKMQRGQAISSAVETLQVSLPEDSTGQVLVDIDATVSRALLKSIGAAGGSVESSFPQYHTLRARLPLAQIEAIAASADVRFIRPAVEASVEGVPEGGLAQRINVRRSEAQPLVPRAQRDARVRAGVSQVLARAQRPAVAGLDDLLALGALGSSLSRLAQYNALLLNSFSLRAFTPGAETNTGSVTSEGDATHRANQARATFGATGAGIKVGVLSDSIDDSSGSYAKALASGDVSPVTVLSGQAGTGAGEGLAMLEIVHDLAPDARLYFATAFSGPASFAQNIRDLRAAGCDIIIDDVGYFNESPFQDDLISQAVIDVTANGALYFASASNSGSVDAKTSGTWEGDFADGGAAVGPIAGSNTKIYRLHLFTGKDQLSGNMLAQTYTAFPSTTPTGGSRRGEIFWSDPLAASTNDYDLFYLSADGATVLASSTNTQNGTQDPYETFAVPVPPISDTTGYTNKRFVIVKAAAAANRFLHFDTGRGYITIATAGVTRGHSAVPAAFSLAATPAAGPANPGKGRIAANPGPYPGAFSSSNTTEGFSSDGPRHVFYNVDGTPITPGDLSSTGGAIRLKPDATAADGVSTTLPSASGLNPFYGTSASAPHAGAIAALLESYNPTLSVGQYRTALIGTAIDIDAAGYDRDSGYGIIDAVNTLTSVPSVPFTNISITPTSVSGGQGATGTVTLRDPAPAGGAVVTLSAMAPASVPSSVSVPAGATSATFPIATAVVSTTQTATIQAVYSGVTRAASLTVVAQYAISGQVTTTAGAGVSGVTVTTQVPGVVTLPSQTNTPNPAIPIPDGMDATGSKPGAAVTIPITFTGGGTVGSIKVGVNITHTFRGDLLLALFAPDGKYVILKNPSGDGTKDYVTTFPDQTPSDEPLSTLFGKPVAGTWQLYVQDYYSGDTGTVNSFTLTLGQNVQVPATATTDSSGNYAFANFTPGTYTLTPTKTGFNFLPATRSITVGPNAPGQNFTLSQAGIRTSATVTKGTDYAVTVTFANGGSDVSGAQVTKATLGTAMPTSPAVPTALGNIMMGSSTSVTYHFPLSAGATGSTAALRVSGSYTGGSFSGSLLVKLP